MAIRPVFIPSSRRGSLYERVEVEFEWYPGFSLSQKQKSISSLHEAASKQGIAPLLEVSTKSTLELGRRLSAFSLKIEVDGEMRTLESVYQSSKVFSVSGQHSYLIDLDPISAKRQVRLVGKGKIISFRCFGMDFETEPKNAFYDWLYMRAIYPYREWIRRKVNFYGYTDIEFNPDKSINCQARAVAEYKSLEIQGSTLECLRDYQVFRRLVQFTQLRE